MAQRTGVNWLASATGLRLLGACLNLPYSKALVVVLALARL